MALTDDKFVVAIARYSEPSRRRKLNIFVFALFMASLMLFTYPFWQHNRRNSIEMDELLLGLMGSGGLVASSVLMLTLQMARIARAMLNWQR